MKFIWRVCPLALIIFLGITACQEKITYNYVYRPYDENNCPDYNLYNVIFSDVRETFIYIITNTYPSTGEMLGVALEVGVAGYASQFNMLVSGKPLFGWRVYFSDVTPLSSDEISDIAKGSTKGDLYNPPTARYYVKLVQNSAAVYARFIMPALHNYDFIFTYEMKAGKWTLTKSDDLGETKLKKK
jgi:hypothetical protein